MAKLVCSLDVGTTLIKAHIYDASGSIRGCSVEQVQLLYPDRGWVEMDPETLWVSVLSVIKKAMAMAAVSPDQLACLGLSTQRGTFIHWRKSTGTALHNFITWKDARANNLVTQWNSSLTMKALRLACKVLHIVTRRPKYLIGSRFKLQNEMVTSRLMWALQNIPELKAAMASDDVCFGTLDSWLLNRLTAGRLHVCDMSSAAATGLFDPFTLDFAHWAFSTFGIPLKIMPQVVDCAGSHFGSTDPKVMGAAIPILACLADQSASMFGLGCFGVGDMKMTLGSGSFLDVNTGQRIHSCINKLVPLVGWKIGQEVVYLAEGSHHDTSDVIRLAKNMKLFDHPSDSSHLAMSVPDTRGIFYVPAIRGLKNLECDLTSGFIGVTPHCGPAEMLRAMLESLSFIMKQLVDSMDQESDNYHNYLSHNTIQIDGGVAKNDFIVQLISNLTGKRIRRPASTEMSSFGVAFMAGIEAGVWKSRDQLKQMRSRDQEFQPANHEVRSQCLAEYDEWREACGRMLNWHPHRFRS